MPKTRKEVIAEIEKIASMTKQEKLIFDLQNIKDKGYWLDEDRVDDILDVLIDYFKNQ